MQAYAATMVLVVLIVQALSEGRRVALESTRAWRLRYERTLDAAGVASVEFDAVTGKAVWGDGASHVLGVGIEAVPTARPGTRASMPPSAGWSKPPGSAWRAASS